MSRLPVWAAIGLFGALSGLAAEARADWTNVREKDITNPRHRELFCMFMSGPSCLTSLSLDGVGAYQRSFNGLPGDKDFGRIAGEIGFYLRVPRSLLHLGVAFEAGGAINDTDPGYHLTPKARLRFWPGYTIIGLELSPGFVYESHTHKSTGDAVSRFGAHGELGVTFAGVFTLTAGGEWLTAGDGAQAANLILGGRLLLPVFIDLLAHIH